MTVASIEDGVDEDTETVTVMHTVNGGDYGSGSVTANDVDRYGQRTTTRVR